MPEFVTKDHFDGAIATIREDIRDFNRQFIESQGEQNKRLDALDERFTQVDQRFEDVDRRFDTVDRRFDMLEGRFDDVDEKLGLLVEDISAEHHLHNLTDVLRKEGLKINDQDIFRS